MNKRIYSILDEESIENIKTLFLKEKNYNGFDKDLQRKLLQEEFYKNDMEEVTNLLKIYIEARPIYTLKKKDIQCYNFQGFSHFSCTVNPKKIARNTAGP